MVLHRTLKYFKSLEYKFSCEYHRLILKKKKKIKNISKFFKQKCSKTLEDSSSMFLWICSQQQKLKTLELSFKIQSSPLCVTLFNFFTESAKNTLHPWDVFLISTTYKRQSSLFCPTRVNFCYVRFFSPPCDVIMNKRKDLFHMKISFYKNIFIITFL